MTGFNNVSDKTVREEVGDNVGDVVVGVIVGANNDGDDVVGAEKWLLPTVVIMELVPDGAFQL